MRRIHVPPSSHDLTFAQLLAEIDAGLANIRRTPTMRGIDAVVAQYSCWSEAAASLRFDGIGPTAYEISEGALSRYGGQTLSIQAASNSARAAGHIRALFGRRPGRPGSGQSRQDHAHPGPGNADNVGASDIDFLNDLHFIAMTGLVRDGEIGKPRRGEMNILDPIHGTLLALGTKAERLPEALELWQAEFGADAWQGRHPLLRTGYAHLAFECHHPYVDGNGRVGRLVIEAMNAENGLPSLGMSRVFETRRRGYVTALTKGAQGEPDRWMEAYLEMSLLAVQTLPAVRRELRSTIAGMAGSLRAAGLDTAQAQNVASTFVTMPFATVPMAARRAKLDERQMREAIFHLEKRGHLTEGKLGDVRLFIARDAIQGLCQPLIAKLAAPRDNERGNDAHPAGRHPAVSKEDALPGEKLLPYIAKKRRGRGEIER